jgi:hypothetical protein
MKIVRNNGQEINSAEIGDNLMLQVEVQPASKSKLSGDIRTLELNLKSSQLFMEVLLDRALPKQWKTI